jgi:tRNA (adenine22-N1)-methyltransferase
MGGETMAHILTKGQAALHGATLILSPQTDLPLVRQTLCRIGYRLRRETAVSSGKRQYILMRAQPALPGEATYTAEELILGPILRKERPKDWQPYLRREQQYTQSAIKAMEKATTQKDLERLAQFRETLCLIDEALQSYEKE